MTVSHTTDVFKRTTSVLSHSTDASKAKETSLAHTTDGYKIQDIATSIAHSTDSFCNQPSVHHTSDSWKRSLAVPLSPPVGGAPGTVLASQTGQTQDVKPELSKNSPVFMDIGNGLSVMVGLPRIATWNTPARPANPKKGTMGFNTQTNSLEIWDGKSWYNVTMDPV